MVELNRGLTRWRSKALARFTRTQDLGKAVSQGQGVVHFLKSLEFQPRMQILADKPPPRLVSSLGQINPSAFDQMPSVRLKPMNLDWSVFFTTRPPTSH